MSIETAPAVILVRPSEEGNIGATARAMANMGLDELVIVEPAVRAGDTARAFAVGARHILANARRAASFEEATAPYQRLVATTSERARSLDLELLAPQELASFLEADPAGTATALVFGPERSGLTTEELLRCSPVVTVPCAPEQPTLNLAQAVLILTWELRRGARPSAVQPAAGGEAAKARAKDVHGLFAEASELLATIGFDRDNTFEGVVQDLRQLAARAALTQREVDILRGVCRRAGHALAGRAKPRAR